MLSCRDVRVRFGGVTALDGVTFEVKKGRSSGSSARTAPARRRSSTASAACTRWTRVTFSSRDTRSFREPRHRVATLGIARTFQNVALFDTLTVTDNVILGAHARWRHRFFTDALRLAAVLRDGASAGERGGRAHRRARPRRGRRPARRRSPFWHPQADRARSRARGQAATAHARRAGRRAQSRRDRRADRVHPLAEESEGTDRPARRASHEHGHGHLGQGRRPRLRTAHRRRGPGRREERS